MLTPTQLRQFQRDGFLLGGKILDEPELKVLRSEILRVIHQRDQQSIRQPILCHNMGKPESPIWQIVNIWMASEPFHQLLNNPTICEEVAQLHTDANALRIWHDQIQFKPASGGGVNMWHQDSPYWGILTPKDAQITAWVALDDVDESNGCMSMVPGSHAWGNHIEFVQSMKDFGDMAQVGQFQGHAVEVKTCPVPAGHVHYHHSLTWHGSHANTSPRPRRAVALHYMTDQTRYVAGGNHVMKPYVTVPDGEVLRGDAFPVCWQRPSPVAI